MSVKIIRPEGDKNHSELSYSLKRIEFDDKNERVEIIAKNDVRMYLPYEDITYLTDVVFVIKKRTHEVVIGK